MIGPVRWARELDVTPFMKWLDRGIQFDFGTIQGTEASWAHVYSANVSIKRNFLERVGGFDEQRLPYGHEDLDWGYRARPHGLRVLFNRSAIVDHWRAMDLEFWKVRAERIAVTERRFCEKHPEVTPTLRDRFSRGGRAAAAAGKSSPRGQVRADAPALAGPVRLEPGRHLLAPANRAAVSRRLGCRRDG